MQDEHEKEFLEFIPPRHVFAPRWLVEMPYWAAQTNARLSPSTATVGSTLTTVNWVATDISPRGSTLLHGSLCP